MVWCQIAKSQEFANSGQTAASKSVWVCHSAGMTTTIPGTRRKDFKARQLHICPVSFLNQLYRFGEFNVIVRSDGASLLWKTRFGIFQADSESCLFDPVSGLKISPSRIGRICLISETGRAPFFEIEILGVGFSLAIHPPDNKADKEKADCLLGSCAHAEVNPDDLQRLGAGAWLDERLSVGSGAAWTNRLVVGSGDDPGLHAEFTSKALSVSRRLHVSNCDHERNIWRFSDTSTDSVIYLDLSHPRIHLSGFQPARQIRRSVPSIPPFEWN